MFQLGSLVVLCGLLTGTSASLPEFIQKLTLDMQVSLTQESETRRFQFDIKLPIPNFSLDSNRFNFPLLMNIMRIRLNDLPISDLQAGLSANDNSTEMKMSLIVDASVLMPDDNPRDNTTTALKLQCSLMVERESQKSLPYVTMWKCAIETRKDIPDSSGRLVPNGSI